MAVATTYRYVNVAGAWPGARVDGLLADADGRLGLPPGADQTVEVAALSIDPKDGLVGLAVDRDGTIFVADPGGGRVLRVDPCDKSLRVLGCLDSANGDPAAPVGPRGIALGPRGTLVIADPPSGRVLIVDRATGAILDVWSDGFKAPWAVASDGQGRVLVADADADAPSVRRFASGGEEDRAFAKATAALAPPLASPRSLALLADGTILVLDHADPARVNALDSDGAYDAQAAAALARLASTGTLALAQAGPTTWAAGDDGIASATGGAVTNREQPPAAGLAIGCDGRVLLATATALLTLAPGATTAYGTLVVPAPAGLEPWDRVRVVIAEPLPPGTHLRVWTRADAAGPPPPPPGIGAGTVDDGPEAPLPSAAGRWRAAPLDVLDVRPLCAEAETLWIAVEWHGDGQTSPVVDDIRVDRMGRGWLDDLPHTLVARRHDPLTRLLALLASVYEDVAAGIDRLGALIDPAVTPDRRDTPWLARLASWVDVELVQRLDEDARRGLVADAIAVHGRRGTPRGIVDAVRREVGVEVTISEPSPSPAWPLGGPGAALSAGSALLGAPPDPPVLDAGASIDRSWLIDPDERGLPLLGSTAHRFCVHVPAAALTDHALSAAIARVVDREKPAHTAFALDATTPRSTVGTQRVGIGPLTDASAEALRFDGTDALGSRTVLRGHQPTDPPTPGRVGISTVVGVPDPERTINHHD